MGRVAARPVVSLQRLGFAVLSRQARRDVRVILDPEFSPVRGNWAYFTILE